jgi:hypothetical protein
MGFGLNLAGENRMQIETENFKSTVETLRFGHGEGLVFYASLPCGPGSGQIPKRSETIGKIEKHHLACLLLDHLAAIENPQLNGLSFKGSSLSVQVVHGWLDKPILLVDGHRGPAISFSESGGKVWAALAGDAFDIGVDVASPDEFKEEYPYYRVFHPQEIAHALKIAEGDSGKASALLWSIKEAFVKALGCGFHLVDPLQISIDPAKEAKDENGAYGFPVGLLKTTGERFPVAAGQSCVRSFFHGKCWLSISLLNRPGP